MNKSNSISFILLLILSFFFLHTFYGEVLLNPNSYLFNQNGDGIKNYFTYASHIRENTVVHSGIMNYPYGESFLYLDCQPLLTVILQGLSVPFPSVSSYSIGIINFLMIFSIFLSSVFLYLLFNNLNVHKLLSVAGALSISVLSPQILRISSHLALSYSFFIPLSLYLFIKFTQSEYKVRWSVLLFINNLSWFFIHAYLGMIITSFLLLFFLFDFIFYNKSNYRKSIQWLYISLQTFLPIISFWLFITLTDNHLGRTNNPYGFLVYTASINSIFLPNHPPLRHYIETYSIGSWEGWVYIGAGSVFTILFFFIRRFFLLFRKKVSTNVVFQNKQFIVPALLASLVLLFLSLGYPFKWKMEYLLDWLPFLKSFRASGRFAWVFYYVITISSIYYWSQLLKSNKKNFVFLAIAIVLPISYFWEGIAYHKEFSNKLQTNSNLFDRTQLTGSLYRGLEYARNNEYQAIIPLPYYHIGSENFTKSATNKIYRLSMILSYHSGIPLMSNYSTNTSIPESKKLVQIISPGFYQPKLVREDIDSDKPFLIIYSNEGLSEFEKSILERGKKLYNDNDYSMFSITPDELFRNTSEEEIRNFEMLRNNLIAYNGFLITAKDDFKPVASDAIISYNSFEDSPQELAFRGNGSYLADMKNYNRLANIDISRIKKESPYIVSFWMYNEGGKYGQDVLNSMVFLEVEFPTIDNKWLSLTNPARSCVINGSWSLIELEFKLPDYADGLTLLLKGDNSSIKNAIIDDVLIRAKDTDVYKVIKEENGNVTELFKNNHKIIL